VLNLTGPAVSVRWIGEEFGRRWGVQPGFANGESETALLSDASECARRFGPLPTGVAEMIEATAQWVEQGGRSLGKPTHFETRDGAF
jgi:hypothetical protein